MKIDFQYKHEAGANLYTWTIAGSIPAHGIVLSFADYNGAHTAKQIEGNRIAFEADVLRACRESFQAGNFKLDPCNTPTA